MSPRASLALLLPLVAALCVTPLWRAPVVACCPAPRSGEAVVNADQTVVILWDAATKTQHFIRQASFKSDADDFGFLIPSPSRPELNESGNDAFPFLAKLTAPEVQRVKRPSRGVSCGCEEQGPSAIPTSAAGALEVLEEKLVAGFNAAVLKADSADVLVEWLADNGYAFSPEVEAWAEPYVKEGWVITALKVAKPDADGGADAETQPTTLPRRDPNVAASALRMTFKTDRPLFPYREPDYRKSAQTLDAKRRLLRIYFLADARYAGELTPDVPWTGKVAFADKLKPADRSRALELLGLPETTGPAESWLTEFEDPWPYRVAPADVYFSAAPDQSVVKRPPIVEYVSGSSSPDVAFEGLVLVALVVPVVRRIRRRRGAR